MYPNKNIMKIANVDLSVIVENPLDAIGFFGPAILFIEAIPRIWNQRPYLIGYLVTFFINYPFNQILKKWFREPRPDGGKSFIGETYNGADHYGMPSLHAQTTSVTSMFLYLTKGFSIWVIIEFFVMAMVVHQRFVYKRHTMKQLLTGLIVGGFIGWLGWFLTNWIIYHKTFFYINII
jgi:membrane-associated phospholipid phosphatase